MNVPTSNLGTIELLSTHFMVFTYDNNLEIRKEEIKELLNTLKEYVTENGKVKLIVEIPDTTVLTLEAMSYMYEAKYKNENTVALALVMKSIAQRVGSKYYHTKIEVGVPTKFFKTKEEAISWITEI